MLVLNVVVRHFMYNYAIKLARKAKYLKNDTMIILNCRTNVVLCAFSMLLVDVFVIALQ